MAFGVIIIGDEILSGRRTDKHLPKVIQLLTERGLALGWAEYIGDDPERRNTMATTAMLPSTSVEPRPAYQDVRTSLGMPAMRSMAITQEVTATKCESP